MDSLEADMSGDTGLNEIFYTWGKRFSLPSFTRTLLRLHQVVNGRVREVRWRGRLPHLQPEYRPFGSETRDGLSDFKPDEACLQYREATIYSDECTFQRGRSGNAAGDRPSGETSSTVRVGLASTKTEP